MISPARILFLLAYMPALAAAHEWQEDSVALSPEQISDVLAVLEYTSEAARTSEWSASGFGSEGPTARFYEYALTTAGSTIVNAEVDRVIAAFEAFRLGEVDASGAFVEGADFLRWVDFLHPSDVVAIQPYMDDLLSWWATFPGASE